LPNRAPAFSHRRNDESNSRVAGKSLGYARNWPAEHWEGEWESVLIATRGPGAGSLIKARSLDAAINPQGCGSKFSSSRKLRWNRTIGGTLTCRNQGQALVGQVDASSFQIPHRRPRCRVRGALLCGGSCAPGAHRRTTARCTRRARDVQHRNVRHGESCIQG